MAMPPAPQKMAPDGSLLGARVVPGCMAKCFHAPCAISGYDTGDATDGSLSGPALIACLLNCLLWPLGSIYTLVAWAPDPKNIQGDGTQRTLNNRCCAVCCLGGPCAIAFWQTGDNCSNCCDGDAGTACILNCIGYFIGISFYVWGLGDLWACCCWQPNVNHFKKDTSMHGGRARGPGDVVEGAPQTVLLAAPAVAMVQQPVMVAQQPAVVVAQ